jgi:amyloid beta precursor protein binding protein 1
MSDEVLEVVLTVKSEPLSQSTGEFSLLVRALEQYLGRSGEPPLPGLVPDMTCTTELFVRLQEVFATQAAADRAAFRGLLDDITNSCGAQVVSEESVERFCRNARHIMHVTTSRIEDELAHPTSLAAVRDACADVYADAAQVGRAPLFAAVCELTWLRPRYCGTCP